MRVTGIGVVSALLLAIVSPAWAHSLQELERRLLEKERYMVVEATSFPDFNLQDAAGRSVTLGDFRDTVVVANFIYARCPDECPLHSELIADVQAGVNRTPMKDLVRFVSITTDPEHDTPEVLKAYGAAHGLDPANWVFLRSEQPDATRKLAARLRQKFTAQKGVLRHAVVTYLIDRRGRLRARYFGLKFDPASLILHINALANATHHEHHGEDRPGEPSFWNRLKGLF